MRRMSLFVLSLLFSASSVADATPISYEFTTNWTTGEWAGTMTSGRFTYDSSRLNEFGRTGPLDSFDDFEFVLGTSSFTESDVRILSGQFDQNGNVITMVFGNNCSFTETPSGELQPSCWVSVGNPGQFVIGYDLRIPQRPSSLSGQFSNSNGRTTMQRTEPNEVPEPNALLLLVGGLGAMGMIRSNRKKNRSVVR